MSVFLFSLLSCLILIEKTAWLLELWAFMSVGGREGREGGMRGRSPYLGKRKEISCSLVTATCLPAFPWSSTAKTSSELVTNLSVIPCDKVRDHRSRDPHRWG